ncbi:predicted protein [Sparassis crispa]|uniref:Integrase catalytic domain-containing protein n=1 Tax=Sparassis crispa TaxID=139825 RepID=A0A401G9U8_9APHY|nr:predicted protein [Sparassis crispa]GBE78927.1 predicted protein [Sparassis crispa]
MSSTSTHTPNFAKLNDSNYPTWSGEMAAWLRFANLWRLVNGKLPQPKLSGSPTAAEQTKLDTWEANAEKAAGQIYLMVEPDQRTHFAGVVDDPIKMWEQLAAVHLQKKPGARFNAYDDVFSIRKQPEESLQGLVNKVNAAMQRVKDLRPNDFNLTKLDEELTSMAMIRALPVEEYGAFTSALLQRDILSKDVVTQAFVTEEINRRHRTTSSPKADQALTTASSSQLTCDFCEGKGHTQSNCYAFQNASKKAKENHKERRSKCGNKANATAAATQNTTQVDPTTVTESAGKASLSDPLQLDADFNWNADTGATSHMTPHHHWLRNYKPLVIPIKLADNTIVMSAGVGTVVFNPVIAGKAVRPVEFTRVLHVPRLRNNLLSCLYLVHQKGFRIHIESKFMTFLHSRQTLFVASITENYTAFLDGTVQPAPESAQAITTVPLDLNLWHRRFAHHNYADVQKMIREELVTGLMLDSKQQPDPICEPCLAGKMHANPFPTSDSHASKPLELIHTDVHGPLPVCTHSGYRYWITFIDDYSRFRVVLLLKAKSEAFDAFKQYKAYAENLLEAKIKAVQDDKGGEYMSNAFIQFTQEAGIERRHTTRNRPQQNGVAERANRTMDNDITAMLAESKLPPSFWGECIASMVHVWNRLPTAVVKGATPYELWYKRKPDVSHLRVWGCTAYVHVQKDQRIGLGPHMQKCVFIGYPAGYKGWKFYNPDTKKTIISERADFDERYFPGLKCTPDIPPPPSMSFPPADIIPLPVAPVPGQDLGGDGAHVPNPIPGPVASEADPPAPPAPPAPEHPVTPPPPDPSEHHRVPTPPPFEPIDHRPIAQRRVPRNIRPTWKMRTSPPPMQDAESEDELDVIDADADFVEVQFAGLSAGADPRTYKQAMGSPDADKWQQAANEEIMSLMANNTWDIVPLPPGKRAIGSGWVFKVKHNADGSVERYKGRLVAKGHSQRPGFDYTEVFAPTFRQPALRLILALAAAEDLELHSVDISSAFLNGDLEEEIYMQQPEGFHQGGPEMVCRLNKSLYGLKQGARQWNKKLHEVLTKMGFTRLQSDRSIYVYIREDVRIIVPVFIDDMTLASKSKKALDDTVKELKSYFKLRDLGSTQFLLGIDIKRDRAKHTISLSQRQYIVDMLERYGLSDCKSVSTPMNPGAELSKALAPQTQEEAEYMHKVPYLSAVGALMYLAITTRPDIMFAIGCLARFNANPGPAHWIAVKHVFRYLKGTMDLRLHYGPSDVKEFFLTYTDSDFGGERDNRRSTGGYLVKVGTGAISWSSKLQSLIAQSTTEAEYIAAVEAGKEILWMRNLLTELGYTVSKASTLYMDNQSAISVSKNPEHHGRMKHLDLRFFWLRDTVEAGRIAPVYIPTAEMIADILTKPLPAAKIIYCREMMGLRI